MAIKIVDVKIKTNYAWLDIKNQADWNAVKNTNSNWHNLLQTTTVGQPTIIEVEIIENNWQAIKDTFNSWADIKSNFASWLGLKNW